MALPLFLFFYFILFYFIFEKALPLFLSEPNKVNNGLYQGRAESLTFALRLCISAYIAQFSCNFFFFLQFLILFQFPTCHVFFFFCACERTGYVFHVHTKQVFATKINYYYYYLLCYYGFAGQKLDVVFLCIRLIKI